MRISDWSSDVCSSDLIVTAARSWRGQVEEAEARAKAGAPAFVYQLDFEAAKHTDDIGLSFGTMPDPTPAQQAMSDVVMDAFVRFARTGDPGWPAYDFAKRTTLNIDAASRSEERRVGKECVRTCRSRGSTLLLKKNYT